MNLAVVFYLLMLFVVLLSIGKSKNCNDFLQKLGFGRTNLKKETRVGIFYLAVLFGLSILVANFFTQIGMEQDAQKVNEAVTGVDPAEVIILLVMASFVEEIFFRGYLQRRTNILVASAAFSYWHIIYGSWTELAATFVMGLALGYAYQERKNLFAPIFSHLSFNIIAVALMYA